MDTSSFEISLRTLTQAATRAAGAFARVDTSLNRVMEDTQQAFSKATRSIPRSALKVGQRLESEMTRFSRSMTGSLSDFTRNFDSMLRGVVGGTALIELTRGAENLTRHYHELADNGQMFGGSMIEMAHQAADAKLSLGEFTALIRHNTTVSAVLADSAGNGANTIAQLALSVRNNLRPLGMLGMTIEQVDGFASDFAETLRQEGRLNELHSREFGSEATTLARHISQFSAVTGKSREQIAKITFEALRDVTATARLMEDGTDAQKRALDKTVAFMASLPDTVGKTFANLMTQTYGSGNVALTQQGQMFYQAGVPMMAGLFQRMQDKIQSGNVHETDFADFIDEFKHIGHEQIDMLRWQAISGNEQAKEVLQMYQQMQGLTGRRLFEQQQTMQGWTKFINLLEDSWKRVTGAFWSGFTGALAPIEEAFKGFGDEEWKPIEKAVKALGATMGSIVTTVFTAKNVKSLQGFFTVLGQDVEWLAQEIHDHGKTWISAAGSLLRSFVAIISPVLSLMQTMGVIIGAVVGGLRQMVKWMSFGHDGVADVVSGGVAVLGYKVGKAVLGAMWQHHFGMVNIKAAVVNVEGTGLGDLLRQRGGPIVGETVAAGEEAAEAAEAVEGGAAAATLPWWKRAGKKVGSLFRWGAPEAEAVGPAVAKLPWWMRIKNKVGGLFRWGGPAETVGAEAAKKAAVEVGAKAAAEVGAETVGKSLLKRGLGAIPGIGTMMEGGSAISDAFQGNWKGAGLHAMSGVASVFDETGVAVPLTMGLGTAADVADATFSNAPTDQGKAGAANGALSEQMERLILRVAENRDTVYTSGVNIVSALDRVERAIDGQNNLLRALTGQSMREQRRLSQNQIGAMMALPSP